MKTETLFDGPHGPGIYGFFGDYRWLSNFWLSDADYEGEAYPSVEAAYQAAKTEDLIARADMRVKTSNNEQIEGKRARLFGRKVTLRPDWEDVKLGVMESIVRSKFEVDFALAQELIDTGDLYLEETNYWGDKFWGVCNGVGENHLGKILMKIRDEMRFPSKT